MGRKANIIKSLEMMGYTVDERHGNVYVVLLMASGYSVVQVVTVEEIEFHDYIVEHIVSMINSHIIKKGTLVGCQ